MKRRIFFGVSREHASCFQSGSNDFETIFKKRPTTVHFHLARRCRMKTTSKEWLRRSREHSPTSLVYHKGSQALIWDRFCQCCGAQAAVLPAHDETNFVKHHLVTSAKTTSEKVEIFIVGGFNLKTWHPVPGIHFSYTLACFHSAFQEKLSIFQKGINSQPRQIESFFGN